MLRPEKNSYKEFGNEKKFLRLKNYLLPIIFLMVRPLGQTIQPILYWTRLFPPGLLRVLPMERADNMYIKLIIYHIFLDPITQLYWPCSVPPFYPSTVTYMYDWLMLLRWGSLELLHSTFLYVISGRGLVNNNCQENGINKDNYCSGRITNLIEETLKMAIVSTWFFVWKKSPAFLFDHKERQHPTEVDLFGQINMCTS